MLADVPPLQHPVVEPRADGLTVLSPRDAAIKSSGCVAVASNGRFALATLVADGYDTPSSPAPILSTVVGQFMASTKTVLPFLTDLASHIEALQILGANSMSTDGGGGGSSQGFNLVVGDGSVVGYFCNRHGGRPDVLLPGVYVLSNGVLNTPWPKMDALRGPFAGLASAFVRSTIAGADFVPAASPDPAPPAHEQGTGASEPGAVPLIKNTFSAQHGRNAAMCADLLELLLDTAAPAYKPHGHTAPPEHYSLLTASPFVLPVVDPRTKQPYGSVLCVFGCAVVLAALGRRLLA